MTWLKIIVTAIAFCLALTCTSAIAGERWTIQDDTGAWVDNPACVGCPKKDPVVEPKPIVEPKPDATPKPTSSDRDEDRGATPRKTLPAYGTCCVAKDGSRQYSVAFLRSDMKAREQCRDLDLKLIEQCDADFQALIDAKQ